MSYPSTFSIFRQIKSSTSIPEWPSHSVSKSVIWLGKFSNFAIFTNQLFFHESSFNQGLSCSQVPLPKQLLTASYTVSQTNYDPLYIAPMFFCTLCYTWSTSSRISFYTYSINFPFLYIMITQLLFQQLLEKLIIR